MFKNKSFGLLLLASCFSLGLSRVSHASDDTLDTNNNFNNSSHLSGDQTIENLESLLDAIKQYNKSAQKIFNDQLNQFTINNSETAINLKSYHDNAQSILKSHFSEEDKFLKDALIILRLLNDLKRYEIKPENLKPKSDPNNSEEDWIQHEQMSGEFYFYYNTSSLLGLISGTNRNGQTQLRLDRLREIPKQLKKPANNIPTYGMPPVKNHNAHFMLKGIELEKVINNILIKNSITNLTNLMQLSQDILEFLLQAPNMHLKARWQESYLQQKYMNLYEKLVSETSNTFLYKNNKFEIPHIDNMTSKMDNVEIKLKKAIDKAELMARIKRFVDEILAAIRKQGRIS